MKKYFVVILLLISCLGFSQSVQTRLGIDSASGNVKAYKDTIYTLARTPLFIFNSYGNFFASNTDSIGIEGITNLWFTNARARSAISLSFTTTGTSGAATGSYNSSTGVFSINVPQYSGGGGGGAISALTAATATNSIDNLSYKQKWNWSTLAGDTGLVLSSNNTTAASNKQSVLSINSLGANTTSSQTTYGATFSNTHTGTSSTNVAASFTASGGTNNYAAIFTGNVGFGGQTAPAYSVDIGAAAHITSGLWLDQSAFIRGVGSATIFYIDGNNSLGGDIHMRSTTVSITGTTNAADINGGTIKATNNFLSSSAATPSFRLNNTTVGNTWLIENGRYTTGGLEFTNATGVVPAMTITTGNKLGINNYQPTSDLTTTSFATGYAAKGAGYTLGAQDHTIEVTATGQTMTLPTAVGITGREYVIKLTASGSASVATTSSQTIDGSTTYSLSAQYKYVTVQSNGANWLIIANN